MNTILSRPWSKLSATLRSPWARKRDVWMTGGVAVFLIGLSALVGNSTPQPMQGIGQGLLVALFIVTLVNYRTHRSHDHG